MSVSKRINDPEQWSCLSDEQRDVIAEWYKRESEQKEKLHKEKLKQELNINDYAFAFSITPFAFYYGFTQDGNKWWQFIINSVSAFLMFAIIVFVFREGYTIAYEMGDRESKIKKALFNVFAVLISLSLTWFVLDAIKVI